MTFRLYWAGDAFLMLTWSFDANYKEWSLIWPSPFKWKELCSVTSHPADLRAAEAEVKRSSLCLFQDTFALNCLKKCADNTAALQNGPLLRRSCHFFLFLSINLCLSACVSACVPRLSLWSLTSVTFSSWFMRLSRGRKSRRKLRRTSSASKLFIR